jgi:membrane associated rhomboid family serine protease
MSQQPIGTGWQPRWRNQLQGKPLVTYAIVAICVVVYLLCLLFPNLWVYLAVIPGRGLRDPWTWLTNAFVHSPPMPFHLLFNMFAVLLIGQNLERALGAAKYAAGYLICALGGTAGFILLAFPPSASNPVGINWISGAVGASGAIFGLFGIFIGVQGIRQAGSSLLVLIGLTAAMMLLGGGIAWQSHLGGLLVGLAIGWWINRNRHDLGRGRSGGFWGGMAAITVILLAAIVSKYVLIGYY